MATLDTKIQWKVLFVDEVEEEKSKLILSSALTNLPVSVDVQVEVIASAIKALVYLQHTSQRSELPNLLMLKCNLLNSKSIFGEGLFCPQEFIQEVRKLSKDVKIIIMSPEKPRLPVALRTSKDVLSTLRYPFSQQTLQLAVMGSLPSRVWSLVPLPLLLASVQANKTYVTKKRTNYALKQEDTAKPDILTPESNHERSELLTEGKKKRKLSHMTISLNISASSHGDETNTACDNLDTTATDLLSLHDYAQEIEDIIQEASNYLHSSSRPQEQYSSPVIDLDLDHYQNLSPSTVSSPVTTIIIAENPYRTDIIGSPFSTTNQATKMWNTSTPRKLSFSNMKSPLSPLTSNTIKASNIYDCNHQQSQYHRKRSFDDGNFINITPKMMNVINPGNYTSTNTTVESKSEYSYCDHYQCVIPPPNFDNEAEKSINAPLTAEDYREILRALSYDRDENI